MLPEGFREGCFKVRAALASSLSQRSCGSAERRCEEKTALHRFKEGADYSLERPWVNLLVW
jgi:hypothetical protein